MLWQPYYTFIINVYLLAEKCMQWFQHSLRHHTIINRQVHHSSLNTQGHYDWLSLLCEKSILLCWYTEITKNYWHAVKCIKKTIESFLRTYFSIWQNSVTVAFLFLFAIDIQGNCCIIYFYTTLHRKESFDIFTTCGYQEQELEK